MEFVELRFADACRTATHHTTDDAAHGVALSPHVGDELFHQPRLLRVGTAHSIHLCHREVVVAVVVLQGDASYLHRISLHADAHRAQCQLGKSSTYHTAERCACRGSSASTIVARTIFIIIGIVGVRRSEEVLQRFVVGRPCIFVPDDEGDGGTRRPAFKHAAHQLYAVALAALRRNRALTGSSAVELLLDEVEVDDDAWRHTVHYATDGLTVALAEGGQPENLSEGVHGCWVMGVG